MSDDRFEQEEPKDEDVEAHRRHRLGTDDDEGSDTSDDVEAHKKMKLANDELLADDSDDVEAHRKTRL
jgi:hypothetical protein